MPIEDHVFAREAAKILGVSVSRVHQFVMEKRLKPLPQKFGSSRVFVKAEVERFAKERPQQPGPRPRQSRKSRKKRG